MGQIETTETETLELHEPGTPNRAIVETTLKDHPALSNRHGYNFLRDEHRLEPEPDIDEAFDAYLDKVDLAFRNEWPLHPNVRAERSHAELLHDAFELDFREGEMARIRSILPADKDVFDLIDVLGEIILYDNLDIYLEARRKVFRKLTRWPLVIASVFLGFFAILIAGFAGPQLPSGPIVMSLTCVSVVLVSAVFTRLMSGLLLKYFWNRFVVEGLVNRRNEYESSVRDATGLVSGCLAQLAHEIKERVQELKNRLDRMGKAESGRTERAPELVRLLLWFPERLGLIENYYRARVDHFVKRSAERILESDARVDRYLKLRESFLTVIAAGLSVLVLSGVVDHLGLSGHVGEMDIRFFAMLAFCSGAIVAGLMFLRRPLFSERSALRFLPSSSAWAQHLIARGRGWGVVSAALILAVLSLSNLAATGMSGAEELANLAYLLPHTLALIIGLVVGGQFFQRAIAHRLYVIERTRLSANVMSAVVKKMENSTWAAYSSVRVDKKIAEVYAAVYSELNEWKRARIQQGG
jgi:hypothetical protein